MSDIDINILAEYFDYFKGAQHSPIWSKDSLKNYENDEEFMCLYNAIISSDLSSISPSVIPLLDQLLVNPAFLHKLVKLWNIDEKQHYLVYLMMKQCPYLMSKMELFNSLEHCIYVKNLIKFICDIDENSKINLSIRCGSWCKKERSEYYKWTECEGDSGQVISKVSQHFHVWNMCNISRFEVDGLDITEKIPFCYIIKPFENLYYYVLKENFIDINESTDLSKYKDNKDLIELYNIIKDNSYFKYVSPQIIPILEELKFRNLDYLYIMVRNWMGFGLDEEDKDIAQILLKRCPYLTEHIEKLNISNKIYMMDLIRYLIDSLRDKKKTSIILCIDVERDTPHLSYDYCQNFTGSFNTVLKKLVKKYELDDLCEIKRLNINGENAMKKIPIMYFTLEMFEEDYVMNNEE